MTYQIIRATEGPKHHLFGFHDLVAFNQSGDKLLSLEANVINRPPLSGEQFGVGYSLWKERRFVELGKTVAMNYPQGARQQWLSDTEFIVNDRIGDHWGAKIYDVSIGEPIASIDSTAHCVTQDGRWAFGINYARLFRLGGYGYIGLPDPYSEEAIPSSDGIYKTDIYANKTDLLVSIADVARCDFASSIDNGTHHYVTHPSLSPDNKRIAFLHRFFLADGGIRTRLMTVGTDGSNLRCLAYGFLSHFDWRDDEHIFIWGRTGNPIDALRSNSILNTPFIKPLLSFAKLCLRNILRKSRGLSNHFLMIEDTMRGKSQPFAIGLIDEDGHPMCNPINRKEAVFDTYPNVKTKNRTLFFYNFESGKREDIGEFFMGAEKVDVSLSTNYLHGIDEDILQMVSEELISFTRSGLHCDLHPRWDAKGNMVSFDSIHEGTRQIYIVIQHEM